MSLSRKQFLLSMGLATATPSAVRGGPKVLLVVAHPDDEYFFAATVYRIAQDMGGVVDQVVITNGEAGYRYSTLAESYYKSSLTDEATGRARLPEIRRRETLAAGRVLGIRRHHFLNQRDSKFTLDAAEAFGTWNVEATTQWIHNLMARERYDFVFGILPTADTHGHHQAATRIALDAASRLPEQTRPVVLGAEPAISTQPVRDYGRALPDTPVFRFNRAARLGLNGSLSYQIVVNWMIAEYKSQGLFQTECNKLDEERFWVLAGNAAGAGEKAAALFERVRVRRNA